MESQIGKSSKAMLVMQRNLFLCLSLFLALATMALSIVALKKETITLFKPPESRIDVSALESQARYLAHLILNQNPTAHTADCESIIEWVAPSFQIPLRIHLLKAKKKIIEEKKSFEWEIKDAAIEIVSPTRANVFLHGDLRAYIPSHNGNKQLVEAHPKHYLMEFTFSDGKPLLENFTHGGECVIDPDH